jgi:hypothetical protein
MRDRQNRIVSFLVIVSVSLQSKGVFDATVTGLRRSTYGDSMNQLKGVSILETKIKVRKSSRSLVRGR